jgi:hypothetical protein
LSQRRCLFKEAAAPSKKPNNNQIKMKKTLMLIACPLALAAVVAKADIDITPSFSTVPTGWATDRYAPNSFSDVGTFQGRNNVLGIGISSAQSLANRPAAYQYPFYNTQGDGYQFSSLQGAGSVLSADLYISSSMSDPDNGAIRTDMWGVMNGGADYPILGFANSLNAPEYTGSVGGHFQIFDENLNNWVILSAPVDYNAWNTLAIDFTGTSYVYSVNGSIVYTDGALSGSTGFSAMIMEAVNFGDPSTYPGVNAADYTADWANTPVPEPTTILAGVMMLLPFGASSLRVLRRNRPV